MKTKFLHYSKKNFLFTIFLLSLLFGVSNIGWGQTKTANDNLSASKKVQRIQVFTAQPDKVEENNQILGTVVSNENSFENSQIADPPVDGPLANRTASVSGNWNNTATWGGQSVPVAGDNVTINQGVTVTVNVNAACASITFATISTSNSAITISGTNSLTVSGLISMPRPSNGETCTINVNAGTLSCGSLTMNATTTTRNDIINITTGNATISGTLTTGTTGCRFIFSDAGTLDLNGTRTNSPTIIAVSGSTVKIGTGTLTAAQFSAMTLPSGSNLEYSGSAAQTVYATTYLGNLGFSGAGTKTIAGSATVTVNGDINNSSTLVLTAGTSTTSTWLVMGSDVTNTGIIDATASYIRFIFSSANAQTFTNNGTVTSPLSSFDVSNTNASGLTLAGSNSFVVTRANLFTGTVTNSNKITLGNGGTSYAVVQRGVASNTSSAGSFDVLPGFNVGTGGLILLYDNGSVAYNTGNEVPGSLICDLFYIFDAADVTLNSDLTINEELNFYGGTGTPTLRIGANSLILGGTITYTVAGAFFGGANSDLVMNGSTTLNAITNGLHDLTINNSGGVTLGGSVTVNNTLTLTDGRLTNGANLTMASGTTISRTATGTLSASPTFGTVVNVIYTDVSVVNTGYEIPTSSTVLYNLTTNTGGTVQSGIPSGGTVSTLYSQGFNTTTNPSDWVTEILIDGGTYASPAITYVTTGTYPTVTPTEGTRCVQFNSYDCDPGDQIRLKKNSSPIATTGKTDITVIFDWYMDNSYTNTDNVTVQWSTNGTTWNNSSTYYRYSATNGWVTNNCILPAGAENQATIYIALLFTGAYGNNCHLDNLKVNINTPGIPTASTASINGTLDLTIGTYTIGGNTLALNGGISGSNAIIGGSISNLTVGGSSANLVLPTITNGLNNFTITRPNGVSITSTNSLTVNGTLNNTVGNNGLIIKADNIGNMGSLIHNTANVPATVEQYLAPERWHLVTPPISDATINVYYDIYLKEYNESDNSWTNLEIPTTIPMNETLGYYAWVENDWLPPSNTVSYKGQLNTGNFNLTGFGYNPSTNPTYYGFRLVGNPYPCALDWNTNASWNRVNLSGWMVIKDNTTYKGWNPFLPGNESWNEMTSGIIPSTQGFWVRATNTGASMTIPASQRVHSSQTFYKNGNENPFPTVRLNVEKNGAIDETVVIFHPDGHSGFDGLYDLGKFSNGEGSPDIYSVIEGNEYAVNVMPEDYTDEVIPVYFKIGVPGTYHINTSNVENFTGGINVYLQDIKTGNVTTLVENTTYEFEYLPTDEPHRFNLHFKDSYFGLEDEIEFGGISVYSCNDVIFINLPDENSADIMVYDMMGRQIVTKANC